MNTTLPGKAVELCGLINRLARLAANDAAQKGWSLKAALDEHRSELLAEFTAKNFADVLWTEKATEQPPTEADAKGEANWLDAVLNSATASDYTATFLAGVRARLEELILRLQTTGSLLRQ
jgi:hypothetical protein